MNRFFNALLAILVVLSLVTSTALAQPNSSSSVKPSSEEVSPVEQVVSYVDSLAQSLTQQWEKLKQDSEKGESPRFRFTSEMFRGLLQGTTVVRREKSDQNSDKK